MTSIGSYSEEPNILLYNNPQQIPTAQNWGELTQLLAEPPNTIVLSPNGSFFAVNSRTMNVLLSIAQSTIAMGLNSHMAYLTLNHSDIPTAQDQAELIRLFAVPLSHSAVHYDGYYAVKPTIMAFSSAVLELRCRTRI